MSVAPARSLEHPRRGRGAAAAGAIGPNARISLQISGRGGVPGGVAAVALNVTVTQPTGSSGFITAWADGGQQPLASNLYDVAGQTVPNLVITPVSAAGKIDLFNGSPGTAHLDPADVLGYYLPDRHHTGCPAPAHPTRLLDTRTATGVSTAAPVAANGTVNLAVAGRGGVPATGASAVVVNVTVTLPTSAGYITVWGDGARPNASNLNFYPRPDRP